MAARDALNYYFESDRTPGTIVHGLVVDTSRSTRSVRTHDDAVTFANAVLDLHPLFRRRLQTVTANLAFPLWVECEVAVADHVFVHRATGTDDHEFLRRRVVDASRTPVDFDAPAWQLHFVTDLHGVPGVPNGGTVLLFKVHHSAIDGMGTADLVHRMLAPANLDVEAFRADDFRRSTAQVPTTWSSLRALPRDLLRFGRASVARASAVRRLAPADRPQPHKYPATRFNNNTPPDMTFDLMWFDLDRVRRIKSAVDGATVNDVIMTVVSLGISEYLADEMPADTLGASFPVNVRPVSHTDDTANQLAIAVVDLATDVSDPLQRLADVSSGARARKAELTRRVQTLPPHPLSSAPAPVLAALAAAMPRRPATPTTTSTNTMISNIAYGNAPMEVLGAPVVGVFAPLPVVEGVQLAHVVMTTGRRMCLTAVSDRNLMPDIGRYIACLTSALDRLDDAVLSSSRVAG